MQDRFGNPGDAHPALYIAPEDPGPIKVVISDHYLKMVEQERITPHRDEILHFTAHGVEAQSGKHITAGHVLMATGYSTALPPMGRGILQGCFL